MHLCVHWRFIMSWLTASHQYWNKSWTIFSIFDLWKPCGLSRGGWHLNWNSPSFVADICFIFFLLVDQEFAWVSLSVTVLCRLNANPLCDAPHGVGLFFRSVYREGARDKSGQKQQGGVWNRVCICPVLYFGPVADCKIALWTSNSATQNNVVVCTEVKR